MDMYGFQSANQQTSAACPTCGQQSRRPIRLYGRTCVLQCDDCRARHALELPPLQKKIFYLDQNAVSNLAHTRSNTGKSPESFWFELNQRLTRALHKQLVVCPISFSHQVESAVSPHFESFMRTAEHFAAGCSFQEFGTIREKQLKACFFANLKAEPTPSWRLQARDVIVGDTSGWVPIPQDPFLWQMSEEQTSLLRTIRQQAYADLTKVFKDWKSHPERRLADWFETELKPARKTYGALLLDIWQEDVAAGTELGLRAPTTVLDFVESNAFAEVPFLKISSWLYATAARKALHQEKPPNRGFLGDVEFIACLLPYCDAIFVDRSCHAYLNELNSTRRLDLDTHVFSLANKDELIEYLYGLESTAPAEQLRIADQLYGTI